MGKLGDHAVVIGASMGGLLAARVLADAYHQVTLLERDELPSIAKPRKGVPQARHGHGLHPAGLQVLDELFPGFSAEVAADGAPLFTSTAIRAIVAGHELRRADMGAPVLSTSRPFLEGHVRRRITALEETAIMDRCDVVGPVSSADGERLTGVRVLRRRDGATEVIDSDLVVDATGRAGHALRWLDDLGFRRPAEEEVHVGVAYATRHIRLPAGALGGDRVVVVGPQPGRLTGMYLAEQERNWWILTVFGYRGNEPSRDPGAFAEFVSAVAPGDVVPVLKQAEPLSEVFTHRLPSSIRRRYERLRRIPEGFLVFGDAICSFNPIYGQGMSVAALQAVALRRALGRDHLDPQRFFRDAARPVGDAWALATGSDLSLPEVPGVRPANVRMLNRYVERVLRAAERDPEVSRAFLRTIGMLDRPPSLLRPRIAGRVARYAMGGGPPNARTNATGETNRVRVDVA